jgi:hypothetical protein
MSPATPAATAEASGGTRTQRRRWRIPLLALGALSLAAALWGGLLRLGWELPFRPPSLAAYHGPLMVSGFLGTVIGLERAVALGEPWAYAAPLCAGLGALALLTGAPPLLGGGLMTLASGGLLLMLVRIWRRQPALFTAVMTLGGAAWLVGQVLWLAGLPLYHLVYWWAGFLVLTIAGERLELARLVQPTRGSRAGFTVCLLMMLAGLIVSPIALDPGVRVLGAGLLALALWLASHDIALRTVRQTGLTRFIASCLLSGYVWLAASGVLVLTDGGVAAGPRYDAMLHALFVGFVLAMIFGHAPIIIPAVVGWRVTYRPAFYAHLALLHATLALRIGGDLAGSVTARRWGGLLNVASLVVFAVNTALSIRRPGSRSLP